MKHFDRLTELECALVKLDTFVSTMRVLTEGAEGVNRKDILSMMYFMTENLENISNDGMSCFQILFNEIKNEQENKKPVRKPKQV